MKLTLKPVSKEYYRFLYDLLKHRPKDECISHKKMPTYTEHVDFLSSYPYKEHYIVLKDGVQLGRVYISNKDEIGVSLIKKYNHFKKDIFEHFKTRFVNVSPGNKRDQLILKKLGYKIIQYTYENILS